MAREGKSPEKLFSALRLFRPGSGCTEDGRETLTAVRGRAGLWGAWVCHLGILLLILGFALGQLTMRQYPVTAMPGQTKPLGDTGLFVTVNDFRAETREDGSPIQYTADLTVADPQGGTEQAWGSYWSWDPKETWSLVTWIVYAVYLHLRIRRGWKEKRPHGSELPALSVLSLPISG